MLQKPATTKTVEFKNELASLLTLFFEVIGECDRGGVLKLVILPKSQTHFAVPTGNEDMRITARACGLACAGATINLPWRERIFGH